MRITDKYVFFYKDWLSNYQRTDFDFPSKLCPIWHFTSTEKAFMYFKAIYFKDYEIADRIMQIDNPDECRKLGRKVKNFDDVKWEKVRYKIFDELNYQKYTQDSNLREKLLDPKFDNKIFVEASPIDLIWGVGLDENNPLIDDKENWKGKNYLGRIITNIRYDLTT